jgi:hypothetical protein
MGRGDRVAGRKKWTAEEIEEQLRAGVPQIPEHVRRVTGLSRTTVKRWIDDGKTSAGKPWRHITRGRNRLVVAADVIAYLDESREIRTGKPKPGAEAAPGE